MLLNCRGMCRGMCHIFAIALVPKFFTWPGNVVWISYFIHPHFAVSVSLTELCCEQVMIQIVWVS